MANMDSVVNKEINMDFMIDERIKRLFRNSMCYYYEGCYNYVEPFAKGLQLMSTEAYDETFGRFRDYCGEILFDIFARSFKEPFDDLIIENEEIKSYFWDTMYEGEEATHIVLGGKNTFYEFDVEKFYNEVFEILAEQEEAFKEEIFNG